ncbi:MAG: hypothetical protein PHY99_10730 [Bacteroidales bacterium]|nr:hypothetical protein [Bacteroidales bacterium]
MRYLIALALIFLLLSCETEIEVTNDLGSVPIVYCILNQDETLQSVRLTRSYLMRNGQVLPGSSDSLNVPGKVNLSIERVENSQVTETNILKPVAVQKDLGVFPSDKLLIYQAQFRVLENTSYRLIMEIKDWDYVSYSSMVTVGDFDLVDPAYPEGRKIHVLEDHNPQIHWTKSQDAAVYQIGFKIHYLEMQNDTTLVKSVSIPFLTAFYRDDPGGFYTYSVNSNKFYIQMAESLPADSTLLRQFLSADVYVMAGNESLGFYLNAQERLDPFMMTDYKNILNGQGVFGSYKTKINKGFLFDDQTLDSLAYGSFSKQLNFLDSDGHRNN